MRHFLATVLIASLVMWPSAAEAADPPALDVQVVADNLSIPWDLAFLPDGSMLFTERTEMKLSLRTPDGNIRTIFEAPGNMWSGGETGLMAVDVAKDFATTRAFFTCHGHSKGSTPQIRVVRWQLNNAMTSATKVKTLLHGIPVTSGRHGGCALEQAGGTLFVGTGDAATGTNPQKLTSGGGKVLHIDATTGRPYFGNPWAKNSNYFKSRIWTYGHRNVQGLARRNGGRLWSNEHGSYRDDEVNLLRKGGNYGWNPVPRTAGDASYNESSNSPMTDYSIPGKQFKARWRSGYPTVATSGATFVYGRSWGAYSGTLAVSALKDSTLRFMRFSKYSNLKKIWIPEELDQIYGRLRGAVQGPDGSLYLTTSNSKDGNPEADQILRVTPIN